MKYLLAIFVTMALAACGAVTTPPRDGSPFQPADLGLRRAEDLNPDPHVVEVNLEAKAGTASFVRGKSTEIWGYDGGVPGPLIEAHVGDRVVVHLKNSLAEPTSIHWHGIRVPADQDGMEPVAPGATRTYDFVVPDAGLYWYHPHFHTNVQVEKGLYGAFVVRGDDTLAIPERILMLDDALLDDQGRWLPTGTPSEEMMGREGNVALVNGHPTPAITVSAGAWERWRIVSAANARYFDLTLPDAELIQIGSDGGWLPRAAPASSVLITPGERVDLLVHFQGAANARTRLTAAAHTRGHGITTPAFELMELRYGPEAARAEPSPVPERLAQIAPLDTTAPPRVIRLQEQMSMQGGTMTTRFLINGESWPLVTPAVVKLGGTEVWDVVNESEMDHPFHLHGFSYQPVWLDGSALPLQWKDTMNVPAKKTLRLAVRFADHTGMFVFHCHILEHAELGMIGEIEVMP